MFWFFISILLIAAFLLTPLIVRAKRRKNGQPADVTLTQVGGAVTGIGMAFLGLAIAGPYVLSGPQWVWPTIGICGVLATLAIERYLIKRKVKLIKPLK